MKKENIISKFFRMFFLMCVVILGFLTIVGTGGGGGGGDGGSSSDLIFGTGSSSDDHGDSIPSATFLTLNQSTSGNIEVGGDADYFFFRAYDEKTYNIETSLITLNDTVIYLYNENDYQIDSDDDGGIGYASKITYTCDTTAPFISKIIYVKVVAFRSDGTGTYTLKVQETSNGGGDTSPPTTPTGLTATAVASSQIALSWNASTDDVGVTKYYVYRDGTLIWAPPGTSYTDIGLNPSTQYCYTITAIDAEPNESEQSSQVCETTLSNGGTGDNLGDGLDNTSFAWITGGDDDWTYQTSIYYYDDDAIQSGAITHGQNSWVETTITGPGTISFYWKVSSEANYDYLRFYIDDVEQGAISGGVDWTQQTYSITSGSHTLEWAYTKDGSVNSGSDAGWLDYVVFTPQDVSNPTFTDDDTNLIWQDNNYETTHNWQGAVDYCSNLDLAGYSDWRLPTTDDQLWNLYDKKGMLNSYVSSYYWSTTLSGSGAKAMWFGSTKHSALRGMDEYWYVRCVRGTSLIELSATQDAYIAEFIPDSNNGGDLALAVGKLSGTNYRSFIQFDVSSIPIGSTIETAELTLIREDQEGSFEMSVKMVAEFWSEYTITWNSFPITHTFPFSLIYPNEGNNTVVLNVKEHVEKWVSGDRPNYGFILTVNPSVIPNDNYVAFESREQGNSSYNLKITYR